jgi:PAS domain S-box-containing protein
MRRTHDAQRLQHENEELRQRLEEAEAALRAIRSGEVDAVLVEAGREQVFTLESADRPYRLLVEQMPQGAATLTVDGAILFCNQHFADLVGRPLGGLVGTSIRACISPASRPLFEALLRGARAAGTQGEVMLRRGDGSEVPVYLGVKALREGAVGLCLMVTDLTEHKRHEALLAADRRKDEFLAMLAHELRNPLAPICNVVQFLLMKGTTDPDVERARGVLARQTHHLTRLVDDLLDVSRIGRDKVDLHRERVRLAAVVECAVETSRPLIEAGCLRLTVELPPVPVWLDADATRLAQVVANLHNNAAKYTEPGGHIWLTCAPEEQEAVIRVRDTGVGIPTEMLARVFEPFVQAERSRARAQGGLGIGLTLVKSLVEMHGGSVRVTSAGPGPGSEFVIRLPAVPEPEAASADPDEPAAAAPRRRVLVVDDNRDVAQSLAMLLELPGHDVRVAYDGPGALEAAGQFRPEVVLLDISLPGMDGYEAARQLRRLPGLEGALLVALTGWGQEEDRRRSADAGFDEHLLKPATLTALQKLLASSRAG